ncbi:DUF6783 domain-containing protein, partial [uncultured Robinsoniella sp.]
MIPHLRLTRTQIKADSSTKCDAQLPESNFKTRSRACFKIKSCTKQMFCIPV